MIELERTSRGFLYGEFVDRYGNQCSIQKSSIVANELDDECIWLGVENSDGKFKIFPRGQDVHVHGKGWQEKSLNEMFPFCDVLVPGRMHLSRKMVEELLPILEYFVKTGELPEPKENSDS